jgi:hypothetical protein
MNETTLEPIHYPARETAIAPAPWHCDYHTTFSHEPDTDQFSGFDDLTCTCYHEAGHAISSIVLGRGLSSVSVSAHYFINEEDGGPMLGYGGTTRVRKDKRDRGRFVPLLNSPTRN